MAAFLKFNFDKFTFRVATDRLYSREGIWAQADGEQVTVGLSDFRQQRSGDIAFAEILALGSPVKTGEAFADLETIKADVELSSPVTGTILKVNPKMDFEPEIINEDPYGAGWLAIITADNWSADRAQLLTPDAYFVLMQAEAQEAIEEL